MEENQKIEETTIIKDERCICDKHPILKSILCGLLIFLGAYCAFYTVADWHFKRIFTPPYLRNAKAIEHHINKDFEKADKMFAQDLRMPYAFKNAKNMNIIHLKKEDDEYKVFIDLKAFDNNDKNVNVTTNGNILTINGRSVKKTKNNEQISEFQQNYMFGDNVKLEELTKETEGNYYVIKIPIRTNNYDDND